ncbi:MAG: ATP-binding protein [Myxococcota bacterium]
MSAEEENLAYDEVAPNASAMIESMRAYGYTLATAIADLIDNSIAAGCSKVWLDTWWSGAASWITITDDGHGMSEAELRDAMRLGSRSPVDERTAADLGRFGLGMKTASLAQCRRLTVVSRRAAGSRHVRRWDLDHLSSKAVSGWQLLRTVHPDSTANLDRFEELEHGTAVIWEVLDRVVQSADKDDATLRAHFLRSVEEVEVHLGMVFHRYLGGPRPRLEILVNGHAVQPWDPFVENHPATTPTPQELIALPDHKAPIVVRGFVLPHKDKLGDAEHAAASGPAGWNAQQGFYLYRNERLIVAGSWLGLGGGRPWTKEEHYKLARIRLDVPNSMDHLWHLDVKKSHATPPPLVRERLLGLAQSIRQSAREVYAHRGRYGARAVKQEFQRPWKVLRQGGRTVYRIDRKHPLVATILGASEPVSPDTVEAVLRIVEETVPIQQIWLDSSESPQDTSAPFAGTSSQERRHVLAVAYAAIQRNRGLNHRQTVDVLLGCEEFADDEAHAIIATLGDKQAT